MRYQTRLDANLQNRKEVEAITHLAHHLQEQDKPYRIITPYDAQRGALEEALREEDLKWEDKCFNVDSFQGPHYYILHAQRARSISLMTDTRGTR